MDKKLIEIMEKIFDIDLSSFNADDIKPENIQNWDSMGHINLIASIEEEFEVEFDPFEIADLLDSYTTIKNALAEKLGG